jgi:hypothetical protein
VTFERSKHVLSKTVRCLLGPSCLIFKPLPHGILFLIAPDALVKSADAKDGCVATGEIESIVLDQGTSGRNVNP